MENMEKILHSEVSILKRQISDLQKENEDLKNENKRLKRENQGTDLIKCMEQIQEDLRPRYVRLDELIHNPGLQHIATHVFKYLDPKSVGQCRAVSNGWKSFIDNDKYWWIKVLEAKKMFEIFDYYEQVQHQQHLLYRELKFAFKYVKLNASSDNLKLFGRFILDFYCWFDTLEDWSKYLDPKNSKSLQNIIR